MGHGFVSTGRNGRDHSLRLLRHPGRRTQRFNRVALTGFSELRPCHGVHSPPLEPRAPVQLAFSVGAERA